MLVPGVNVIPVVVDVVQCVPEPPVRVMLLEPSVRARVLLLVELKNPHEHVWLFVSSVPRLSPIVEPVLLVMADVSCHEPPDAAVPNVVSPHVLPP